MEDYRQVQKKILDKRSEETAEFVRRVMKRLDESPVGAARRPSRLPDPLPPLRRERSPES